MTTSNLLQLNIVTCDKNQLFYNSYHVQNKPILMRSLSTNLHLLQQNLWAYLLFEIRVQAKWFVNQSKLQQRKVSWNDKLLQHILWFFDLLQRSTVKNIEIITKWWRFFLYKGHCFVGKELTKCLKTYKSKKQIYLYFKIQFFVQKRSLLI